MTRHRARGGPRRGVALLTHAMMANGAYLVPLATSLARQGIESFVLDFRGHGRSVPPSPRGDSWGFESYVRADLPAALARIAELTGTERISFLGHSLGGLVGLAAFATGAAPLPARLALVAASPWVRRGPLRLTIATLLAALARPLGRLPACALGLGSDDEPRAYLAELSRWVRERRWPYADALARITSPSLIVIGARDSWCTADDAAIIADRLGGPVRWRREPDSDHFGFFRDRGRDELWHELGGFLAEVE